MQNRTRISGVMHAVLPTDGIAAIESGSARLSARSCDCHPKCRAIPSISPITRSHLRLHETHFSGDFHVNAKCRASYRKESARARVRSAAAKAARMQRAKTAPRSISPGLVYACATSRSRTRPPRRPLAGGRHSREGHLASHTGAGVRCSHCTRCSRREPAARHPSWDGPPKFIVPLTQMPSLRATARLTLGPSRFALRDLDARGGDLAVRGLYAVRAEHRWARSLSRRGCCPRGSASTTKGSASTFSGSTGGSTKRRGSVMRLTEEDHASRSRIAHP